MQQKVFIFGTYFHVFIYCFHVSIYCNIYYKKKAIKMWPMFGQKESWTIYRKESGLFSCVCHDSHHLRSPFTNHQEPLPSSSRAITFITTIFFICYNYYFLSSHSFFLLFILFCSIQSPTYVFRFPLLSRPPTNGHCGLQKPHTSNSKLQIQTST